MEKTDLDCRTFTLYKIKEAFTKTFLHAGELWFNYFPDENGKKPGFESIEGEWDEFVRHLEGESVDVEQTLRRRG